MKPNAGRGPGFGTAIALSILALQPCARAALEVDFVTTRGTITAVMEYEKAPRAVANLITLAQGSRAWIDFQTGMVCKGRFFDGQDFFNITNTSALRTLELGSPSANGTDDPGYTFPDEFDPTLTHSPYVLSMSNVGPNTNGARFCFTGDITLADRNPRHTVFGSVPSSASRAVIDQILVNGSIVATVISVAVRATDPAAQAFDPAVVSLPEVTPVESPLAVQPGVAVSWLGTQPGSSVLRAYQSTDLENWSPHYRNMAGLDDAPPPASQIIDQADLPARFYAFSLVTNPDASGVTSFANRTLAIEAPELGTVIYQFNAEGTGGTYQNVVFPGEPPFFSGPFEVREEIPPFFDPYSFQVLLYADGLGGSPFNLIRGGLDTIGTDDVVGHHGSLLFSPAMELVFESLGALILSRP